MPLLYIEGVYIIQRGPSGCETRSITLNGDFAECYKYYINCQHLELLSFVVIMSRTLHKHFPAIKLCAEEKKTK